MTERHTKADFARFIRVLVDGYDPTAEQIELVMENLNTQTPATLDELFEPVTSEM